MNLPAVPDTEQTLLKVLLRARHWQKHSTFAREWDKIAKGIDPILVGTWPRHAQFYRWLRGELRELPYPDACRVLESMFPNYSVKSLFEPCPPDKVDVLLRNDDKTTVNSSQQTPLERARVSDIWPQTNQEVLDDLVRRVTNARQEISVFGLSRNYCAEDEMLPLFEAKACEIPVTFYIMDPQCESRQDRYRLEPAEAAMEDPTRYIREILRPLFSASRRIKPMTSSAGIRIFTFNFPCSFAVEKIDRSCRVMLYGHGKRGTESPIMIFEDDTPYWKYFADQIEWLERLAHNSREPWTSRGLIVRPLEESDLAI
ncbi:MAG: hypothetical protein ACRDTC_03915 [Pseudonocardiaceae bacterium]